MTTSFLFRCYGSLTSFSGFSVVEQKHKKSRHSMIAADHLVPVGSGAIIKTMGGYREKPTNIKKIYIGNWITGKTSSGWNKNLFVDGNEKLLCKNYARMQGDEVDLERRWSFILFCKFNDSEKRPASLYRCKYNVLHIK
jgi:hypothetical protein